MSEKYYDYEIKKYTTFKIGGKVKSVSFPGTIEELIDNIKSGRYDIVMGNCSNVLFSDDYIDKNIIITSKINQYNIEGNRIKVYCGTKGPVVSSECAKQGLSGFEFLIGFPGSFGGMICMNASAHNQAISDTIISAKLYDRVDNKIIELNKEQMNFSYRSSIASNNRYIVLEAEFILKGTDINKINDIMQRNIEFRRCRQPSLTYPNAGSIFKNPPNDSAGRLLDLCDMKGFQEGGAKVFENHANFIINYNNASSKDVIKLMYKMYSKVKEKYTIELEPEIKYIGNKETEEYGLWEIMTKGNTIAEQK